MNRYAFTLPAALVLLMTSLTGSATAQLARLVAVKTAAADVIVIQAETAPDAAAPSQAPADWAVDGATPLAVGRGSVPSNQAINLGAFYPVTMFHSYYLVLPNRLSVGRTYSIRTPFGQTTLAFNDAATLCESLKVNQEGYWPRGRARYAVFGAFLGDLGSRKLPELPTYRVRSLVTGEDVARGVATYWGDDTPSRKVGTGEYIYRLNLAQAPVGGPYVVIVDGIGRSHPFSISAAASEHTSFVHTRGLYHSDHPRAVGQAHLIAYDTDSTNHYGFLSGPITGKPRPMRGGYHDAGDFDRQLTNLQVPAWMLNQYEAFPAGFTDGQFDLPESGNGIPDWLDEALWGVALWESLQDPDGAVRGGVEAQRHPTYGQVDSSTDNLVYRTYAKDAPATAMSAGLFAHAARLLAPFSKTRSEQLLARARLAWTWLEAGPQAELRPAQRMYAALHLYLATGLAEYHEAFLAAARYLITNTTWPEVYNPRYWNFSSLNGGQVFAPYFFAYLITDKPADAAVQAGFRKILKQRADEVLANVAAMPYPIGPVGGLGYGAGTNQGRYAEPLILQYRLTPDLKYTDAVSQMADYTLGLNPLGQCYVTGLGAHPPSSICQLDSYLPTLAGKAPVPGIVVYGPSADASGAVYQKAVWSQVYPAWYSLPEQRRYCDGWSLINSNEFTVHETMALNICMYAFLAGQK
ncbi:MAG: glycoside hydrolase family 9 protein [Armatimonadetes bacterium]|nr:glycoside hydrolase family 9 protein [Armatimonadota bacterium]